MKLNPIKTVVAGKKIILIDDSIVRGTTITRIITRLKQAGAKEVHLRIAAPAFIDVCYFGTDIDNREKLIAYNKSVDEIRQEIGADSLEYLSIESLRKITQDCKIKGLCTGCFTGKYPIPVPGEIQKDRFEEIKF
jgi:amidophosphoribosyltransferase